jgi:nodulation protein E
MHRVAITGIGLITPLGRTWDSFGANVRNGVSAIAPKTFTLDGFADLVLPVAAIDDFDPARDLPNTKINAWDRLSHLAIYAGREVVKDAGIGGADVDALILGSSTTSVTTLDENYWRFLRGNGRMSPMAIAKSMPNAPVSAVSIDLGVTGVSYAVASACSSANQAIINAAALIRSGAAKTAIAGGVEASLSHTNLSAWNAMRVLSKDTCRPFCQTRSGLVIGEGAAMFMLEDMQNALDRGAHIYAELIGWGQSSDAKSMTMPAQGGIEKALKLALTHAKLQPRDIDYVNAHGTGTKLNDPTEAAALESVFGADIADTYVTSTKGMHGHLLGAAGAIELATTIAGIQGLFVPANVGLVEKIANVGQRSPVEPQTHTIRNALSASYAFGGHNSVVALTGSGNR